MKPDSNQLSSPRTGCAVACSVLALVCFGLPFAMFWISAEIHPGNVEASGFAVLIPAMLTWLASVLLASVGLVLSYVAHAERESRWLLAAAISDALLLLVYIGVLVRAVLL